VANTVRLTLLRLQAHKIVTVDKGSRPFRYRLRSTAKQATAKPITANDVAHAATFVESTSPRTDH